MGTQAEPTTDNPQDTTNPTDNPSDPPTPPTPPSNSPTPSIDSNTREVLNAYQEELRLSAQRNRELEERLNRVEAPPPKTAEEESREFFSNPKEAVRSEIQNAVKPLNDFVAATARNNLISQIKENMRRGTGFDHLDKVESIFDQYLAQYANIDVNNAVASYNAAVGRFVALNGPSALISDTRTDPPKNEPVNEPRNPVNPNPPHVRPSPPPVNKASTSDKGFKLPRPLNENEKKLARFNNMSDEDWWIETYVKQPQDVVPKTEASKR